MGCQESFMMKTLPCQGRTKAGSLRRRQKTNTRTKSADTQSTLEESSYYLTEQDCNVIETALLNHSLLFKARGYANREIMNRLQSFKAKAEQVIFSKGDPSNYFYVIVKGSVEISNWADGEPNKILTRGHCFGDLGIYNKTTRSATATALEDCELVGLPNQNFLKISLQLSKRAQNDVFKEIKNVTIFKTLSANQKHKLSYLAQELKFKKDAVVFKKGQASNCLYVIKQGRVQLSVPGKDPIEIRVKQSFGQSCLSGNNAERTADAVCLQTTVLLAFTRADIEKYLDRQLFDLEIINKLIWAFKHSKNLRVSQIVLENMIQNREMHYFTNNEIIAEKGDPITHLFVSLQGGINNGLELQVLNTDYLMDIKHQTKDLRKTGGGGDVAFISIEDIQKTFHRSFNSLIDLNQNIWKQIESISKIQDYVSSLSSSQFFVVQNKGNGEIGCTLRIRTESNIEFALRIFDKAKTIKQRDEQFIINLREIGNKLYHSLIAKQYRVYSDKHRLYFMSKWVVGEDLFDLLSKTKKLAVNVVKHFAACIINIMEYLHHRRILWRQLKVQSFVIDTHGYLNLIDLMYLEELPEDQSFVNNTQKATFYYLAPEVLSNQGYGFQTDFWALGVLLYRMLVGQFPYGATISAVQDNILEQLLEEIKTKPLFLPNWLTSDVKILLRLLLNPSPLERGLISFSKLKNLTIFKDYDWLGLIQKKVKNIPYTPKKTNQKLPDPIKFHLWLQNVQSQLPPPSILDELEPRPKTSKR